MWRPVMAALVLMLALPVAAKLYKWEDEDGNVHFSDSLPAEVAKERRKREIKSDSGHTEEVVDPPSEAELEKRRKERQERQRRLERKRRRQEKQAERDRRLRRQYSSIDQIESDLEDRLGKIDAQISLREKRIKATEKRLEQQRDKAARMERSNNRDPDEVYDAIDRLERSLAGHREYIEQKKAQKERLRKNFERDIERFRELKERQANTD